MSTPVLHVEHITMQFGGVVAVNDLSMDIYPGEIVALIGPNGAGKTTAFNCITGVYEPTNGRVDFMGEPIVCNHPRGKMKKTYAGEHAERYLSLPVVSYTPDKITKRGIARTFQNIRLFKSMTVFENVLTAMHLRRTSNVFSATFRANRREEAAQREKALELLKIVGLDDVKDELATALPYGKQRRLEIARALATNPKLLLLAARECPGLLPLALFQPREQVIYAGQIVCEGVLAQICADAQVFRHSQVFKYTAALRHKRDTARDDLIGRFSNQIRTVQENFTRFRLDQSGNCLQGGRFACTVRADEGDNFAFFDLQINTFDGLNAAIGDDQIFDFQNVTHPRPPPDTRR